MSENKVDVMATEPMKHILTVIEKKLRNLDKRKAKLDGYRQIAMNGGLLDPDQQAAINKYDEVIGSIKFAREIFQNFTAAESEMTKARRKNERREQILKEEENKQICYLVIKSFNILKMFASEKKIQEDFHGGSNGAEVLSDEEIRNLVKFYETYVCTEISANVNVMEKLTSIGSHLHQMLDGSSDCVCGTTYKALKESFDKLTQGSYFENMNSFTIKEEVVEEDQEEDSKNQEEEGEDSEDSSSVSLSPTPQTKDVIAEDVTDAVPITNENLEADLSSQNANLTEPTLSFVPSQPQPTKLSVEEVLADVQGQYNFFQESLIDQLAINSNPVMNQTNQTNGMVITNHQTPSPLHYTPSPTASMGLTNNDQVQLGMNQTTFGANDERNTEQVLNQFRPSPASSVPLQEPMNFAPHPVMPDNTQPSDVDKTPFNTPHVGLEPVNAGSGVPGIPPPNHIPLPNEKSSGYQSYNTAPGNFAEPQITNPTMDQTMGAGDAEPSHVEPAGSGIQAKPVMRSDMNKLGKGGNQPSAFHNTNYMQNQQANKQNSASTNHFGNAPRNYRPNNRNYGNFDSLGHPKNYQMNGSYSGMQYNQQHYGQQQDMFGQRRSAFGVNRMSRGQQPRGGMKPGGPSSSSYNRSRTFRPQNPE